MSEIIKFIHIADTHIGRGLPGSRSFDRKKEFKDAFDEISLISKNHKCDFLVHSGDIFDSKNPPHWAEGVLYEFLMGLGIPSIFVRGNHDPEEKLLSMKIPMGVMGAHMVCGFDNNIIDLDINGINVNCVALPWMSERALVSLTHKKTDDQKKSYSDFMFDFIKNKCENIRKKDGPKIMISHSMLDSVFAEGSERLLTISDTYTVSQQSIPSFINYTALGHIHKEQEVKDSPGSAYYCGSPMFMTFGDNTPYKSVKVVTLKKKCDEWILESVEDVQLKTPKKMITIKINNEDTLENIKIDKDNWIKIKKDFIPESTNKWKEWLKKHPNIISVETTSKEDIKNQKIDGDIFSISMSSEKGIFDAYKVYCDSNSINNNKTAPVLKKYLSEFFELSPEI